MNKVRELLAAGNSVNFCDENGNSPLHIAAACGTSVVNIELLLKEGADINVSNNMGFTPLMHAARNGHSGTVKLLIRKGADVTLQNKLGLCLLGLAVASKDEDTVTATLSAMRYKVDYSSSAISPIHIAALCGNSNIMSILLQHGHNPNSVTSISSLTPLMMAACTNNLTVVSQLLNFGSDCNITNSLNDCALDVAEYKKHKKMKLIIASKTDKHKLSARFNTHKIPIQKDKSLPKHCLAQHLTYYSPDNKSYEQYCSPSLLQVKKSNNEIGSPAVHSPLPIISFNMNSESETSSPDSHFTSCDISTPVTRRSIRHGFIHVQSPLSLSCDKRNDNLFLCSPSPCHFWTPPPHNFGSHSCSLMLSPTNSPCIILSCSPKKKKKAFQKPVKSWWKVISQKFSRKKQCKHKTEMTNLLKIKCKLQDKIDAMLENESENNLEVYCEQVNVLKSEGHIVPVTEDRSAIDTTNEVHYSETQLFGLLEKFDLQEYSSLFESHEIDMTTFYSLTKDDLEEIGICSPGTQVKFLNLIKTTQNNI